VEYCTKYYEKKRLLEKHRKEKTHLDAFLQGSQNELDEFPNGKSIEDLLRVPLEWIRNLPQRLEDLLHYKMYEDENESNAISSAKQRIKFIVDTIEEAVDGFEVTMQAVKTMGLNPEMANTRRLLKEGDLWYTQNEKDKPVKTYVCLFNDCLAYKKGELPLKLRNVLGIKSSEKITGGANLYIISIQSGGATLFLCAFEQDVRNQWLELISEAWANVYNI